MPSGVFVLICKHDVRYIDGKWAHAGVVCSFIIIPNLQIQVIMEHRKLDCKSYFLIPLDDIFIVFLSDNSGLEIMAREPESKVAVHRIFDEFVPESAQIHSRHILCHEKSHGYLCIVGLNMSRNLDNLIRSKFGLIFVKLIFI